MFIRNRRKKRKEELCTCQGFKSRKIEKAGRSNHADELILVLSKWTQEDIPSGLVVRIPRS